MARKPKIPWRRVPLFPSYLLITTSEKELKDYGVGKRNLEFCMSDTVAAGTFLYDWDNQFNVVIHFKPECGVKHEFITHESLHATNYILHAAGQNPDRCNDECDAYLAGWIASQCYEALGWSEFAVDAQK